MRAQQRQHRQQLPEAKNISLKVTVQIAFRFLRKEGWSWFCFLQEWAAWGREDAGERSRGRILSYKRSEGGDQAGGQGAISGFLVFSLTLDCPPLPSLPTSIPSSSLPAAAAFHFMVWLAAGLLNE